MTLDEVRELVKCVRQAQGDPEAAHLAEDRLYHDVLRAIADGKIPADNIREAAELALTTQDMDFDRWYA